MTAAAARALALVGTRFRRQGRDPAHGLDCVGLAMAALGRAGPADYPALAGDVGAAEAALGAAGLARVDAALPGDVLLIGAGAGQLHLAVRTAAGHVHACARARRVVAVPGLSAGRILSIWRG